jgi:hypothetical protein
MNDTKTLLAEGLSKMENVGWVKHWFGNSESGYCLRGALGDTVYNTKAVPMDCYEKIDAALVELGFGSRRDYVINSDYPYQTEDDRLRDKVAYFNNHNDTTFDDIKRVMHRASELA